MFCALLSTWDLEGNFLFHAKLTKLIILPCFLLGCFLGFSGAFVCCGVLRVGEIPVLGFSKSMQAGCPICACFLSSGSLPQHQPRFIYKQSWIYVLAGRARPCTDRQTGSPACLPDHVSPCLPQVDFIKITYILAVQISTTYKLSACSDFPSCCI